MEALVILNIYAFPYLWHMVLIYFKVVVLVVSFGSVSTVTLMLVTQDGWRILFVTSLQTPSENESHLICLDLGS